MRLLQLRRNDELAITTNLRDNFPPNANYPHNWGHEDDEVCSQYELTITTNLKDDIPPYAILSHTWGNEDDEVCFQDIERNTGRNKRGYKKIILCGIQAKAENLDYFWVDTCCIDKTSSTEVDESITSMFRWYEAAKLCYVYLTDVPRDKHSQSDISQAEWQTAFRESRWFSRGWTLQELIAPASVKFFDHNGLLLGTKATLRHQICDVTGIAPTALLGAPITNFKFSERYDWARNRQTTREEDWAYCLLGIFSVFTKPQYGEGRANAVRRLIKKIKNAQLDNGIQSIVIDAPEHIQSVTPILLDIALLETQAFLDEAREQAKLQESNVHKNAQKLSNNSVSTSDILSTLFTFLRRLAWRVVTLNFGFHEKLDRQLNTTFDIVRGVINDDREIALSSQQDEVRGQETLDKLKKVQDFIQFEVKKAEHTTVTTESTNILPEEEDTHMLRQQVLKLEVELQQLQQRFEVVMKQTISLRTEADAKANELETKQGEAVRIRLGWKTETVWQKAWAYIN